MFTQECRRPSYTECRGLGKHGSAKLPTATAIASGADTSSQYTVEPHLGQKWKVAPPPLSPTRVNVVELPSIATFVTMKACLRPEHASGALLAGEAMAYGDAHRFSRTSQAKLAAGACCVTCRHG